MKDNLGKEIPEPPAPRIPDKNCKHENFNANVRCNRLAKSDSPNAAPYLFTAELEVTCAQCGGSFKFDGLPWVISAQRPCSNVTVTVATLPMRPWDGGMWSGGCKVEMPT